MNMKTYKLLNSLIKVTTHLVQSDYIYIY